MAHLQSFIISSFPYKKLKNWTKESSFLIFKKFSKSKILVFQNKLGGKGNFGSVNKSSCSVAGLPRESAEPFISDTFSASVKEAILEVL